jgi:mannobiose 2-epimerase
MGRGMPIPAVAAVCILIHAAAACDGPETDRVTAAEMTASLRRELLDAWYPLALDEACGGFLSDFTYDWKPGGHQNKMIVTQSRHVWTASMAALFFKEDRYLDFAGHGFRFMKNRMWDADQGGFYMLRGRKGEAVLEGDGRIKTAYGNAFAIYALAAYHGASGDTSALRLAKDAFLWLDRHSRDPVYGGYVDRMARDGSWLGTPIPAADGRGLSAWKDQNSSIHLLEAFTELIRVWPDSLLRRRLGELLATIRDTITTGRGNLIQFMARDWTPRRCASPGAWSTMRSPGDGTVRAGDSTKTEFTPPDPIPWSSRAGRRYGGSRPKD